MSTYNRTLFNADGQFVETTEANEANNKLLAQVTYNISAQSKVALLGTGGTVGTNSNGGEPVSIADAVVLGVNGLGISYAIP
jgi:hypothetical protein